jgi:lysophospholipase L1-like esterase
MRKKAIVSGFVARSLAHLVLTIGFLLVGRDAFANSITQNTSWTIDRSNTTTKYRVVAYGDSIFAGYNGSISSVDRRAAPMVQGEYLSDAWNADIEVIRRTKSGAKADAIYNDKILGEKSYMQATNTRVVSFEMCGNDFLQARDSFAGQTGTCSFAVLDTALANCTKYQELAMQTINQSAPSAKKKMVMNLYYPGYDADNGLSSCTEAATGQKVNKQTALFPRLAKSNWRACNFAAQYGFVCVDAFAEYMGADYDSNGDGKIDVDALRWVAGESEDAYVTRVATTLRSTLHDANTHFSDASTSFDYILSDNTHPTFKGATISVGIFGGTGTGSAAPEVSGAQIVDGKSPFWNLFGHERAGWAHSLFNPLSP